MYSLHASSWSSTYKLDVDGDGMKETFSYFMKKNKDNFDVNLTVTTTAKKTLWEHQYSMRKHDLVSDLLGYEGNISVAQWVEKFFKPSLTYGAKFERVSIKKEEISLEFLKFYSKQLKVSAKKLEKLILMQNKPLQFYYRAQWREDLLILVYIPQLKKFVHFSAGDY